MTLGILQARIRQVPGIGAAYRHQRPGIDRIYLRFTDAEPYTAIYVELPSALVDYDHRAVGRYGNGRLWRKDPAGAGARALATVREECEAYRAERVAELREGSKKEGAKS